jgi:hypothetical protein
VVLYGSSIVQAKANNARNQGMETVHALKWRLLDSGESAFGSDLRSKPVEYIAIQWRIR